MTIQQLSGVAWLSSSATEIFVSDDMVDLDLLRAECELRPIYSIRQFIRIHQCEFIEKEDNEIVDVGNNKSADLPPGYGCLQIIQCLRARGCVYRGCLIFDFTSVPGSPSSNS